MARLMPLRIFLSPTPALRLLISRIGWVVIGFVRLAGFSEPRMARDPAKSKGKRSPFPSVAGFPVTASGSSHAALEAHAEEFLCFDREFHGEFAENFLAKPVHNHVDRVLGREAALVAVENLVLADLRRAGFVLDASRRVLYLDVREGVRAAFVAAQQRVALREVARVGGARLDFHLAAIAVLAVAGGDAFRD